MIMNFIIKIVLSMIFLIIFSLSAFSKYNYKIAFETIPTSLQLANFANLDVYFVLRQLNETLFYLGKNGYTSNILKTWKAESNHKIYELCIANNITFSNNKAFTPDDLKKNLELYANKLTKKIVLITAKNDCLRIESVSYTHLDVYKRQMNVSAKFFKS